MVYDLKNKVVFITGAANGVGAGVVRMLLEEGVKHVAILDIAEEAGLALQDELNAKHGAGKLKFYPCDVTNEEQFLGTMAAVKEDQEYIDLVINNAGIMNDSLRTFKKEILINVLALVTGTIRALELMRKDEGGQGGTIINISSTAALCQLPGLPIYWGTKSAVLQFSNCLGLDRWLERRANRELRANALVARVLDAAVSSGDELPSSSPQLFQYLDEYYNRTDVRVLTVCFGPTNTALLSPQKVGSFDKFTDANLGEWMTSTPAQKMESAAKGVIDAYKYGKSGSTWLATRDEEPKDISADIKKAFDILTVHAI